MPAHRQINYRSEKHAREQAAARRRQAKIEARRGPTQEGDIDTIGRPGAEERFPDAPPAYDGIARTLSRGL